MRGELGSKGTWINGGKGWGGGEGNRAMHNAETQTKLMAAKLSESSHFRQKGHARKANPPLGKDVPIIPDEIMFNPHYSQIPHLQICLLTILYVQPPKSGGFRGHSRTCTEWGNGSHLTRAFPAEMGQGDALLFCFSWYCRQVSFREVYLCHILHFCAFLWFSV